MPHTHTQIKPSPLSLGLLKGSDTSCCDKGHINSAGLPLLFTSEKGIVISPLAGVSLWEEAVFSRASGAILGFKMSSVCRAQAGDGAGAGHIHSA